MIKSVRARMGKREEEGFTLIELLVVVLILGILMAIAIPTYLSLTGGAKTNAAESNMTEAETDQGAYFTQYGYYGPPATTGTGSSEVYGLNTVDSGLNWTATFADGTASTKTVYVDGGGAGDTTIIMGTQGSDDNWYWVYLDNGTTTYAETGTSTTAAPASTAITATSWSQANTAFAAL